MRYLLVQSRDGCLEYPVTEEEGYEKENVWMSPVTEGEGYEKENVWMSHEGRQVFCLSADRRVFMRKENVTISSKEEALLRIPGLKSRIYIRGMHMFLDMEAEEHLYINQRKLTAGEFTLYPGTVLFLKNIRLEVWEEQIAVQGSPDACIPALPPCSLPKMPEGYPIYKRSPRLIKKVSEEKIMLELPGERERLDKKGFLMTVLPSVGMTAVTVAVGLLTGRGIYLLMSAVAAGMTAVFSAVRYVDERKENREKNRKHKERYLKYLWQKQRELASALEREQEIYSYQYPSMKEIAGMVRDCGSRIYERIPSDSDFLVTAVGYYAGQTGFIIEGKDPSWDAGEDDLTEMAAAIRQRYSIVERPREISLRKAHLGMAGGKETVHRQMKILAARIVFSHSYHDLRMVVVYNRKYEEEFRWMRWLPHVRIPELNVLGMVSSKRTRDLVLTSLGRILKERMDRAKEDERNQDHLPHYLFLIDEPGWIMDHGIVEYFHMDGTTLGISVVYAGDMRVNLPEYIGTVLQLEGSKEGTLILDEGRYVEQKIKLYQAQDTDFEWMARNLNAIEHEQGLTGGIPKSVTFLEMYGVQHPKELEIRRRWEDSQSHKSLAVPLGMRSADEPLFLNLHEKAHGPHGVVAGTTGSGKSELIQSFILSLAVNFHPYEAGFLLIDYKGGGMANLFCNLVHHLGTITNLDGAGSMRALASVKVELARRQRIFGSFQVNHINGYMRLFKEGRADEPIPHLFIISDEFAELKKEQPEFMKELVSAARIGRSLGVHLILATQKPAGVVDEQIMSNSRFRMCLKVQNPGDSKEILGTPDAAGITVPGRAYIQIGNNEVYELFQSAMSSAPYRETEGPDVTADDRVYVVNEFGQGELVNQDLSGRTGEYRACMTQLEAVIAHIREVFREEGREEVRKPWLPPLKEMLISPYTAVLRKKPELPLEKRSRKHLAYKVSLGKIDIPEMQEQKELEHDFFKDGNLLFTASSGYGKTVFLTTVLVSLAIFHEVEELNYYILDYGNSGCMPLKELPHTAEYISLDDEERYWKFKKLIADEITARKRMFARYAAPSLEAYQELSGESLKIILVAVDQFDVVKESGIEEEEFFTKLTRDGAGLGIYTVVSVNRINAVRQAALNNFNRKIAGYNFDENETFLAVGRSAYRQTDIKGRVLAGGETVHEAQIYTMAPCGDKTEYIRELKEVIQQIRKRYPDKEAPHIPVLPQELRLSMMREYEDDKSCYLVGLEVETVTGVGFDRTAGIFVIIGNTGSGKTNMLGVLARQAAFLGRPYLFDSRGMELFGCRRHPNILYVEGRDELGRFVEELSEEQKRRRRFLKERLSERRGITPKKVMEEMPFCTVLIDDLDDFTEFMGADIERIAALMKEGIAAGITCIVTVHAGKSRGMSAMDKLVRQTANGLVLSAQGVVPVFPALSTRDLPKPGEGMLFKNGTYRRIRLPLYNENEA